MWKHKKRNVSLLRTNRDKRLIFRRIFQNRSTISRGGAQNPSNTPAASKIFGISI
jgi:hypothetical protein